MTGIAMTGMADRTGAALSGSDAPDLRGLPGPRQKPLKSSGFLPFRDPAEARENSSQFAGHPGVALLNDALLRGLSGPVSGRIAQLVEQMTLNHRVPGSSPGAPTKLFKHLQHYSSERPFRLGGQLGVFVRHPCESALPSAQRVAGWLRGTAAAT